MPQRTSSRRRGLIALFCVVGGLGLFVATGVGATTSADCNTQVNDTPGKLLPCIQTADLSESHAELPGDRRCESKPGGRNAVAQLRGAGIQGVGGLRRISHEG